MQTYDFIIVGAGSAGCVVAERLSASGRFSVLVLEAGGTDRRFYVQMPLGYGKTFHDPAVNWNYKAEPDPGLAGNADHWPRGKLLGGSSSINAMVWVRGHPADYDAWRDQGNPGWGFTDLLPAFKAIEDNAAGANHWRGAGGPLHVTDCAAQTHPLTRRYLEAARQAGLPLNPDFNGESQEGVGVYQITTRHGRRMSAARAFLRPAMKRDNVRVVTNALATRILFEGKRATGVEYEHKGAKQAAHAGREVILCGGSVNSPQLLQLSGVGPAGPLKRLDIDIVHANENVGAQPSGPCRHQLHVQGPRADAQPDPAALVGKAPGRHAICLPALGSAVAVDEQCRRLLPHRCVARPAEHAALFPGLLDRHPEERRAADPDAGPLARLFDRPFQLPADKPRRNRGPLEEPARIPADRRQCAFDEGGRGGDAGSG